MVRRFAAPGQRVLLGFPREPCPRTGLELETPPGGLRLLPRHGGPPGASRGSEPFDPTHRGSGHRLTSAGQGAFTTLGPASRTLRWAIIGSFDQPAAGVAAWTSMASWAYLAECGGRRPQPSPGRAASTNMAGMTNVGRRRPQPSAGVVQGDDINHHVVMPASTNLLVRAAIVCLIGCTTRRAPTTCEGWAEPCSTPTGRSAWRRASRQWPASMYTPGLADDLQQVPVDTDVLVHVGHARGRAMPCHMATCCTPGWSCT